MNTDKPITTEDYDELMSKREILSNHAGMNCDEMVLFGQDDQRKLEDFFGTDIEYPDRAIIKRYGTAMKMTGEMREGFMRDMKAFKEFSSRYRGHIAQVLAFNETNDGHVVLLQDLAESAFGDLENGIPKNTQDVIQRTDDLGVVSEAVRQTLRLQDRLFRAMNDAGTRFGIDLKFDDQVLASRGRNLFRTMLVDVVPMRNALVNQDLVSDPIKQDHYQPLDADDAAMIHFKRLNRYANMGRLVSRIEKSIRMNQQLAEKRLQIKALISEELHQLYEDPGQVELCHHLGASLQSLKDKMRPR